MQVSYPPAIRAASAELGVTLPVVDEIDELASVVQMGQELSPGADFGGLSVKAFTRNIFKRNVTATASTGSASGIVRGQVVAFGIRSPRITPKAAMAAADRLLGDPKIANAQAVVRNTKALAALGDASAKRGLVVLQAVGNIRAAKKTPPGTQAVPTGAAPIRAVTIKRTPAQVRRMAAKTGNAQSTPGVFRRILNWFKRS